VGAELFHADEQTDMTKLIVAFRNFANAPKSIKMRTSKYYYLPDDGLQKRPKHVAVIIHNKDIFMLDRMKEEILLEIQQHNGVIITKNFPVCWMAGVIRRKREADHFCLMSKLKMPGAIPSFPRIPSWLSLYISMPVRSIRRS
jgi:hypothetical protein